MNLAAVIIVVAAAALGAGVAFGGVWALRRFRVFDLPVLWSVLGGVVFGVIIAASVIGNWAGVLRSSEPVSVADVLPYIGTIKAREPALYERIETSVLRDGQDGKDAAEIRANAKAIVTSYVADKVAFLPDDLTYEIFATTRDSLGYLASKREFEACTDLALGHGHSDVDAKLSPELVERSNNNILRVIATQPNPDTPRMPAEEFTQMTTRGFADASQATGIPPEEVDALLGGNGNPAKTCRVMKAFFDSILAQPVDVAAKTLRTLSSGERTGL